jgi:hypothetical protein
MFLAKACATAAIFLLLLSAVVALPLHAQTGAAAVQSYFQGKQVQVKIDMPGTQQGVDLRFDRPTPMDYKQYSSRLKSFGVAIPKDATAMVTTIIVKKDMIEFQLDGGGFGTFGDDTTTTVASKPVEKSNYEKQLEQEIADTDDPDRKRDLQRDLDRERDRRARQDAANQRAAQVASQLKAQQVAQNRMHGGSRFNLRWQGKIPDELLTPDGIMQLLSPYVVFGDSRSDAPAAAVQTVPATAGPPPAGDNGDVSPTARLKQGMSLSDVNALLGEGRQLSESVSADGLKTQVLEYLTSDRRAEVTYVNGVVVRFSINSK